MNNYDYPVGADNSSAPWNEKSNEPVTIEVTISQTLSKTVEVMVDDYVLDDDGTPDFSDCNLKAAVDEQITTPKDCFVGNARNWCLDDYEVEKD